jgi:hypothetical protein
MESKKTVTIYIDLDSDDNSSQPLLHDSSMAGHRVASMIGRIGLCNPMYEINTSQQFAKINELRKLFKRHAQRAMEGNIEFLQSTFNPPLRDMYKHDAVVSKYGMDESTFMKFIQPQYDERESYNGTELRVYQKNKQWGVDPDSTHLEHFTMGVYIVGIHHAEMKKITKYNRMIPSIPRIPPRVERAEDYTEFQDIQSLNLMNLEVSKKLSPLPFGVHPTFHSTGILHYTHTDLQHILRFFKSAGFDYVNILDTGCRNVDVDHTNPLLVDQSFRNARFDSMLEKLAFEDEDRAVGLLSRRRRKKKRYTRKNKY